MARSWNIEAAIQMFRNSMKWRLNSGADYILEEFPQSLYYDFLTRNYPANCTDPACTKVLRCRDGTHFAIETMGTLNVEAALQVPTEEIMKYHIYAMELCEKQRTEIFNDLGCEQLIQTTACEDLLGIGLSHLPLVSVLGGFTSIDNDNYPETLRKVVIANVPYSFSMLWKAVEYLWDAKQIAKFQFVSGDYEYTPLLLQILTPDNLLISHGGTFDYKLPQAKPTQELLDELNLIPKKEFLKEDVGRGSIFEKKS